MPSDEKESSRPDRASDPADRLQPAMADRSDHTGVPRSRRTRNAGGTMSETARSRDPDLDDETG